MWAGLRGCGILAARRHLPAAAPSPCGPAASHAARPTALPRCPPTLRRVCNPPPPLGRVSDPAK